MSNFTFFSQLNEKTPGVSEVNAEKKKNNLKCSSAVRTVHLKLLLPSFIFLFFHNCNLIFPHEFISSLFVNTSASYREPRAASHHDLESPDTQSHMGRLCQTAGYQLRP